MLDGRSLVFWNRDYRRGYIVGVVGCKRTVFQLESSKSYDYHAAPFCVSIVLTLPLSGSSPRCHKAVQERYKDRDVLSIPEVQAIGHMQ